MARTTAWAVVAIATGVAGAFAGIRLASAPDEGPLPTLPSASMNDAARADRQEDEDPAERLRLLSAAEGLLRLGRPDGAIELTQGLSFAGPEAADFLRVRAWALFAAQRHTELAELLATRDQLSSELRYLRGAARSELGATAAAQSDLELLWWQEPAGAFGLGALRALADMEGLYTHSEQETIRALTPRVSWASASALPAPELLAALEKNAPPRSRLRAEVQRAVGLAKLEGEDFDGAVATLARARASTDDPHLRRAIALGQGEAERRRGNHRDARKRFEEAMSDATDDLAMEAAARLGLMLIEGRRYQEAKGHFERLLVHNPVGRGRVQALWGLGWIAFRTGAFIRARNFFQSALDASPFGPHSPKARYWAARALEEMGGDRRDVAAELQALVELFPLDYYAYRATQHLVTVAAPAGPARTPSMFADASLHPSTAHLEALMQAGMIARAHRALQQLVDTTLSEHGPQDLMHLHDIARRLEARQVATHIDQVRARRFPDRSLEHRHLLGAAFTTPQAQLLRDEATRQRVDPLLTLAIAKRESDLHTQKVSSSGALGLMQLSPAVAKELYKEDHKRAPASHEVYLKPEINARLGVRYLGRMLRAFGGNVEMALAAYDAGPGAVTRWRQGHGELPSEIFVEEIPYGETKDYVRDVLAGVMVLRFVSEEQPLVRAARTSARSL